MNEKRIAELRELAGKATPRPWKVYYENFVSTDSYSVCDCHMNIWDGEASAHNKPNAAYIVAAANAVPDLLDALEAKDAEIVRLYMTLKFAREDIYQTICDLPVKSDLDDTLSYIDIAMKQAEKERAGR